MARTITTSSVEADIATPAHSHEVKSRVASERGRDPCTPSLRQKQRRGPKERLLEILRPPGIASQSRAHTRQTMQGRMAPQVLRAFCCLKSMSKHFFLEFPDAHLPLATIVTAATVVAAIRMTRWTFSLLLLVPERFKAHLSLVNRNCLMTLTSSTATGDFRCADNT